MNRRTHRLLAMAAALLVLVSILSTLGCSRRDPIAVVSQVYVTYETMPKNGVPGVEYGPEAVRRVEIYPDHYMLYYGDGRGEFVPIRDNLIRFGWSKQMPLETSAP